MFRQPLGVSPDDTARWTNLAAGRRVTGIQPFVAKVALNGRFSVVIVLHGPKGTDLHALATANAYITVDQHNTLLVS